jgi:EAL domain-containing protein (putative c-di-GMP-specific phosphodiesterase class I)
MGTVREFGLVAGTILGPALTKQQAREEARAAINRIIRESAFHPVFQPVLDLASGQIIGFEALTRFADGLRPDLRFLEAAGAGLGLELEIACLRAALRESPRLPADTWLSLNVSPELAINQGALISLLALTDRPIVLEITEHVPVESYPLLMGALRDLRQFVRLAVDDAGSGYAGLQHILEIQPDIMKLDISLVRGVDHDPGRHAMIAAMVAFARETGAAVLAEGVETPDELAALRALGVDLGQGYLLGRPATIESWVERSAA